MRPKVTPEDYELVHQAGRKALPPKADILVKRQSMASEVDMINIAVFQITAKEWRKKVMPTNLKDNMRNYATQEEQKIIAKLELLNAKYIDHTGVPKIRLDLTRLKSIDWDKILIPSISMELESEETTSPVLLFVSVAPGPFRPYRRRKEVVPPRL
jgi:hypothetical protein